MPTAADARIVVDRPLREIGWDVGNKSVVSTEETAADGCADYLPNNSHTRPLGGGGETKRFSIDSNSAKAQAKDYVFSLGAPFIILSNGREHYSLDHENGDGWPIFGFPAEAEHENHANLRRYSKREMLGILPAGHLCLGVATFDAGRKIAYRRLGKITPKHIYLNLPTRSECLSWVQ